MTSFLQNITGVLVGVWAGFRLSQSQISINERKNLIRSIALEYKRLFDKMESAGINGLIKSGIYQCNNNNEIINLIELIENFGIQNNIPTNLNLKKNKYFKFFQILKLKKIDGLDHQNLMEIANSLT